MKYIERNFWMLLIALIVVFGVAWAYENAPVVITSTTGTPLHILDASGYVQNSGAKQMTSTANWVVTNSAGTAKAGYTPTGVLLALDADDNHGRLQMDGSTEVTQTFGTAEADTNYYIVGSLESSSSITNTVHVKRRNTGTFVVGNPDATTGPTFTWLKIRHTQ